MLFKTPDPFNLLFSLNKKVVARSFMGSHQSFPKQLTVLKKINITVYVRQSRKAAVMGKALLSSAVATY